ncbi:OmpA family protein [Rhodohalobacter halophilus]|uniref:OmpA family protein n=1 Tax=Rhodohalobacter halophilus TaxID=1812810 RepID=UPI00083F52FF|nr:OmpA family protein [Rhodohalobacter halophilus]
MIRITKHSAVILVILASTLIISGCSNWSNTARGAVIGTGGGAAVGAVVGKTLGNTAAGAIAGAAVGGTVGAIIGRNMDRKAEELERELDGVTVQRVEEGIALSFDSGLLFGFDSSELRQASRENLRKLARIMGEDDDTNLMIVGHTDSTGDENYNQRLSERRAQSAASYLIEQGIASSRVQIEGRGETEPIADNETEAGRQENRRVEVAIFASDEYIARLERAQQ